MFIKESLRNEVHNILTKIFNQDLEHSANYRVLYSPIVCDLKNCTNGNRVLLNNGDTRNFRRFIDTRRKVVYWAFEKDIIIIN